MKKKTKLNPLVLAVCVLLLAGLLSGCSGTTQLAGTNPAAQPGGKTTATEATPSPSPSPAPTPTPDPEEEARKQRLEKEQDGFVWEKGYLYAIDDEGNLRTDCWIGVLYFNEDGQYTSGSKALDILVADVIDRNTDDSMTRFEKLRAVYEYTRDHIQYVGFGNHELSYQYAHGEDGWMIDTAIDALGEQHGNCYYFAAEFTALARGLGYQAYAVGGIFSAMEDPHGWVYIVDDDGDVWLSDPEMEYKLQYWLEELSGEEISSYFYRNQQELEGENGLGYAQMKDPFEPERKEAEERENKPSP